jgi:DNA-directed RNA polymerase subunit L
MRINSSTKPLSEVKKSTESSIKMAEEFKQLFISKLG